MQDFAWSVRVAASAPGRATVYVRSHRFEIGEPLSFDREASAPTALEHVLGAIGADVAGNFLRRAKKKRIEVGGVEAVVEGRLGNPLVTLDVVGEEGDPALRSVLVKVFARTSSPDADAVWKETLERSPLARTFRGSIKFKFQCLE